MLLHVAVKPSGATSAQSTAGCADTKPVTMFTQDTVWEVTPPPHVALQAAQSFATTQRNG